MGNKIVHVDFIGTDRQRLVEWYGGLFDWEITTYDEFDYSTFKAGEASGGGFMTDESKNSGVLPYVSVTDVQAKVDEIVAKGGTEKVPLTEMEMVTFAICTDPFGNDVGLVLDPDNA
jgi:predicted enzyme related to lactoylglutathione lyase